MKKILLYSVIALALVLGLILPMAVAVVAQQVATSVGMTFAVFPSNTNSKGTLIYEVVLTNETVAGANDAVVNVTFYPPGPTGAQGAYGAPVVLDIGRLIVVGATVTYNWDGSGGAEARPALAVDLEAIPLNEGVSIVYAGSEFDAVYIYEPPYSGSDDKDVPAGVIWPDTEVAIIGAPETVVSGEEFALTITEENTGAVDLTGPYVEVWKNAALLDTLVAPPDSGDLADPGVLNVGETWSWTISSGPITATTTFVALGFGTDPLYYEVSYAEGYEDERDEVTVNVFAPVGGEAFLVNKLSILVPWIALGAAIIAGAAIFVRRRQVRS